MSEHDIPLGVGDGHDTQHPDVHHVDVTHVRSEDLPGVMAELRELARRHGVAVVTATQRQPYADTDAYQRDAIRTRSTTYTPELLSINWLEQTLANAAQLGKDARRLKKAAFGGVADTERPGGSSYYTDFNPRRVSPQVLHSMLGLINEVGEMAEMIHAVMNGEKPFDQLNWIEEKGDAAWFVFCDCDEIGVEASDVLRRNIAKLRARFPGKFDVAKLDDAGRDKTAETAALKGDDAPMYANPADDPAEHAS